MKDKGLPAQGSGTVGAPLPADTASRGETTSTGDDQLPAPRLPHERDQSASGQAGQAASQKSVGNAALDDLRDGKTSTDRSAETDAAYNRNFDRKEEPPRT